MSTLEQLKKSIARVARVSEQDIKAETKLKDIKADSLHWVQIIVGLENTLDVEIDIDREKMAKLITIQDFVDYVEAAAKKG